MSSRDDYVRCVLDTYRRTLGTTGVRRNDRSLAAALYDRGIPLTAVENALVLAAARRLVRSPDKPPLQPVRSLHYILPLLDEVLHAKVGQDYYQYLRLKIEHRSKA
jgi:hypothetical protein